MSEEKVEADILFIVNGEDVPIRIEKKAPLAEARNKALSVSKNTGRPLEDWEVREESGAWLEPSCPIEDFNFVSGVRLFLTLRVGAGG
jgi:hypothetical protein